MATVTDTTSPIREDRRVQQDPARSRSMNRAILLCVGAFAVGFTVSFGTRLAGVPKESVAAHRVDAAVAVVVGASILYALWKYAATLIFRCPRCGGRTVGVDAALPEIHKYCAACNVEWVTGFEHGGPD